LTQSWQPIRDMLDEWIADPMESNAPTPLSSMIEPW